MTSHISYTKVGIVLVNYNGLNDTIECIQSIKESREQRDIRIYVIDNQSKNNESEIIKTLFSDIIAIRSEVNGGFSAGNNIGINRAREDGCDAIILLNNDTIIDKDMVRLLVDKMDDKTITVPTMFYYDDTSLIWYGGGKISKWTGKAYHLNKDQNLDNITMRDSKVSFATGCCMAIPTSVFDTVGALEEKYFMYCEDTEYCIRCQKAGISIKHVVNAKLWHKISKSTGGDQTPFSTYYLTRNRLQYIKDNRDYFYWTAILFTIISRLVRMIQSWITRNGLEKAFFRALKDFKMCKMGRTF